jgi:hypothetical protein
VAQGQHTSLLTDCSLYRELFAHPEPQTPAH